MLHGHSHTECCIGQFVRFAGYWAKSRGWNLETGFPRALYLPPGVSLVLFLSARLFANECLLYLPNLIKPINTYLEFIRRLLTVAHDPTLIPMQSIFHRYAVHRKTEVKSVLVTCLKSPKNLPNFFPSPQRCHLGIQSHVILLPHHSVHSSRIDFLVDSWIHPPRLCLGAGKFGIKQVKTRIFQEGGHG